MANLELQVVLNYAAILVLQISNVPFGAFLGVLIASIVLILVIWFSFFCVTWRLNNKEVIIVVQRMAGRKDQRHSVSNLQQSSAKMASRSSDKAAPCIVELPDTGQVPWQSVALGENVAYSRDPIPPPPSYESTTEKREPEYDYIDSQRGLTVPSSLK